MKLSDELKHRMIDVYNKEYYDSIRESYLNDNKQKDLLVYEILMSNKWKDCNSSYQVFRIFACLDKNNQKKQIPNLDFLDDESRFLSLVYLKKASDKKCSEAMFVLGTYYLEGKYIGKNEIIGNKLLKEADELSNGVLK